MLECTTASAPSSSGRWKNGVAKVLSTTSQTPRPWAISAAAAMSVMCISGLVGVSIKMSRVLSRVAAWISSGSRLSTKENCNPRRART